MSHAKRPLSFVTIQELPEDVTDAHAAPVPVIAGGASQPAAPAAAEPVLAQIAGEAGRAALQQPGKAPAAAAGVAAPHDITSPAADARQQPTVRPLTPLRAEGVASAAAELRQLPPRRARPLKGDLDEEREVSEHVPHACHYDGVSAQGSDSKCCRVLHCKLAFLAAQ
jgi:hypothetical protein